MLGNVLLERSECHQLALLSESVVCPSLCVDCVLKLALADLVIEIIMIGLMLMSAHFDGILHDDSGTKPKQMNENILNQID